MADLYEHLWQDGRIAAGQVLPEGSEIELVAATGDDLSDLGETERRQLAADIATARADAAAGRGEDIDAVLRRIQGAKPGSE